MSLSNPETRRGLRSVVQAIVALAVIALVAWIIQLLRTEAEPLRQIALALIAIVGLGTSGYIAENVGRALKFKAGVGGIEAGIGEADAAVQGAQVVADAAQDAKEQVAEGVKP